ncbi:MAG: hypothetical protein LBN40_06405 [Oscillospiraceae bacterium]|jgi:hypothetical protein|nr:hypothetical protein [Oscillospiraceae bacterium]
MKLKKALALVTATATALSTVAFGSLSSSAAATDIEKRSEDAISTWTASLTYPPVFSYLASHTGLLSTANSKNIFIKDFSSAAITDGLVKGVSVDGAVFSAAAPGVAAETYTFNYAGYNYTAAMSAVTAGDSVKALGATKDAASNTKIALYFTGVGTKGDIASALTGYVGTSGGAIATIANVATWLGISSTLKVTTLTATITDAVTPGNITQLDPAKDADLAIIKALGIEPTSGAFETLGITTQFWPNQAGYNGTDSSTFIDRIKAGSAAEDLWGALKTETGRVTFTVKVDAKATDNINPDLTFPGGWFKYQLKNGDAGSRFAAGQVDGDTIKFEFTAKELLDLNILKYTDSAEYFWNGGNLQYATANSIDFNTLTNSIEVAAFTKEGGQAKYSYTIHSILSELYAPDYYLDERPNNIVVPEGEHAGQADPAGEAEAETEAEDAPEAEGDLDVGDEDEGDTDLDLDEDDDSDIDDGDGDDLDDDDDSDAGSDDGLDGDGAGNTDAADENPKTGVAIAVVPAILAGAAVVFARKRK